MASNRIIARLDVKGPNLVKGVQFEGLRKLGEPNKFARKYYAEGIDEIIYIDIVASLFGRNNLYSIVEDATRDIFVPITVGGGLRTVSDVAVALRSGADKVAINTAALLEPDLIGQVANQFGSQCMVLSLQAIRQGPGRWEALYNNGRERSGRDVVQWACEAAERGVGEILLTSVDNEGTGKGFDVELISAVNDAVSIPVVCGGGLGSSNHMIEVLRGVGCSAFSVASALHYETLSIAQLRDAALASGFELGHTSDICVSPE